MNWPRGVNLVLLAAGLLLFIASFLTPIRVWTAHNEYGGEEDWRNPFIEDGDVIFGWGYEYLSPHVLWQKWDYLAVESVGDPLGSIVIVHLWPIFALWLIATLWFTLRQLRKVSRRRQEGRCVKCDYDLTGNTTGVCPECGTISSR